MVWQIGAAANAVVAVVYLFICAAILGPLIKSKQLRENRLGLATAAIFFTCAVHHGSHPYHMLLPALGLGVEHGLAMRQAFDWHIAGWDIVTAGVGIWYWSLRKTYAPLMKGAALFEDMKERQRQALELNDNIVQGLVVAKMALDYGQKEKSAEALDSAIKSASGIITSMLGPHDVDLRLGAGDLIRQAPASLDPDADPEKDD